MNILIIGTNRGGHHSLIRLGHRVTIMARASAASGTDLASGYANLLFLADDADDAQFQGLAAALHAARPFDAVHSFHDNWQKLASEIAAALALPCLLTPAATLATLDKAATRALAGELGLSRVRWARAADAGQLAHACALLGFPLIAKPLCGTGSQGVTLLSTPGELSRLDQAGYPLLLESVIEGVEYSVEAFSERGRHRIVAVTEKFKAPGSYVEIGHLVPARLAPGATLRVHEFVLKLLAGIGIENGPSHTEVMLHDGHIELIETHTRTGGDEIPILVRHACGIDLYALEARQVAGESVLDEIAAEISFARHAAVWFAAPALAGPAQLVSISGLERVLAEPGVASAELEKKPGDLLHPLTHSFDRTAHVIALDPSGAAALDIAQRAALLLEHHCAP